jgi:hypothetical protein
MKQSISKLKQEIKSYKTLYLKNISKYILGKRVRVVTKMGRIG